MVECEQSRKELFRYYFWDDGQMNDSLLSNLEAGILSKRQKLKSDKLLTKRFAKDFAHIGEQLNSYNSILLVRVIMGHFDNMSQNKISSFMIINLLC